MTSLSTRVCGAMVAVAVGAAVHAAQGSSFLVAVDEGARLRPVARFDGTRWEVTCDVPTSRATDADGARPPRVIVTAGLGVEPVRSVPVRGNEWRQLEPLVKRLFEARERQESVSAAALASVPVSIDGLFASAPTPAPQIPVSRNGLTPFVYYFRASKTIPDSRGDVDADDDGEVDPKGDLRIDVTGWLRRDGELTSLGTNATLSWEQVDDRPEGAGTRRSELTPVGVVRTANTRVWVMQGRAGELIWYTLYEVDAASREPAVTSSRRTGPNGAGTSTPRVRLLVRTGSRGC